MVLRGLAMFKLTDTKIGTSRTDTTISSLKESTKRKWLYLGCDILIVLLMGIILFWGAASQSPAQPFHLLPPEYPLLTLVPFSLGLTVPQTAYWYQIAFAICMAVIAGLLYFILKYSRSTSAALAFAFYLVLGSWATAEARFDLVPATLTLGAVVLSAKALWKWAFV